MIKKVLFTVLCIYGAVNNSFSQPNGNKHFFNDLILKIDSSQYRYSTNNINYKGEKKLFFFYTHPDAICELNLYPTADYPIKILELVKSSDFIQLDSIVFVNQEYYRTKIKFINLDKSQFVSFSFSIQDDGAMSSVIREIKLFPYTKTTASFFPSGDELYIGEEKVFELVSNNQGNIRQNST